VRRATAPAARSHAAEIQARARSPPGQEELMEANLRLWSPWPSATCRSELIAARPRPGRNIGLMKADRSLPVPRGFKFSTYATWWIAQALSRPSPSVADHPDSLHIVEQLHRSRAEPYHVNELGRIHARGASAARGVPANKVRMILESSRSALARESRRGDSSWATS